ncbi:MAG: metallophosphoesterase family protein [Gemmatimonadales bacterium]
MSEVTIAHVSDLHFGGLADLEQIEALDSLIPTLRPNAVVLSGDVTQRARHGEFQAARALLRRMQATAPTLIVPGNHDVQWWQSPLGLLGSRRRYAKYRHYFGEDLHPVLEVPGAVLAGAVSAFGLSLASMSLNPNDLTVKGHLPRSETTRLGRIFERIKDGRAKVLVLHHNVLRGTISGRMGLSRWLSAERRLLKTGADVVLCGHDHEEGAGQIGGVLPVSTAGTLSARSRGGRPSVFNLVRIDSDRVQIEFYRWDQGKRHFRRGDVAAFARPGAGQRADAVKAGA